MLFEEDGAYFHFSKLEFLFFIFCISYFFKLSCSEKTCNSILTSNFKLVLGPDYKFLGALKEGFVGDWKKVFSGSKVAV